ncbi:MAG: phosphoesterase [Myxococcales bacterium]|nr:phosphoesterase [Myxococcota bacterium]MDW8282162.1 phosphoesterase [Myxococcales bacterium]
MRVRVLYHDNCFDGAASAALFTAFYLSCIEAEAQFEYVGMTHGPGDVFADGAFLPHSESDVEHVCVDFRYSPDPRLSWWFDHHQSAFISPEDQRHFEQTQNPRHFYDPTAQSCTKFVAERCAAVYGFDPTPHADLIRWADLIDGARFESPQVAVELREPALQLMTWVEANRDETLKVRFIRDLYNRPLEDIAQQAYVREGLQPIMELHHRALQILRERAACDGGVVTYDTSDASLPAANKFIPYYLFPECHYVVGISAMPGRLKISVGSNPWHAGRRTANIADICSRYGGGGHPMVGAVSLRPWQRQEAQQIAAEIARELRQAAERE